MAIARAEVVQAMLDLFESPAYLEIGVSKGVTFHMLAAASKVAVDPLFRFDVEEARREHPAAAYHEVTSDAFFRDLARDRLFDVIYIDGLHTFEQTLRDLMNGLSHVHPGSVIVIDDVHPPSLAAALPDIHEARKVRAALGIKKSFWMGDVYRLVMFVETFMPAWDYRCTGDNHGQLVMWRADRAAGPDRLVAAVGSAGYERVLLEPEMFRFEPLQDIVAAIRAAGPRKAPAG